MQQYQSQQEEGISSQAADLREFVFRTQQEYTQWKKDQERQLREFASNVKKSWGYFRTPSNKIWVEYSVDTRSVSEVDFEKGRITVEVLANDDEDKETIRQRLTSAIERVIKSHGSKESLPVESTNEKDKPLQKPVLSDQVADNEGLSITEENAKPFAEKIAGRAQMSSTSTGKKKLVASFSLVPDHLKKRMEPYLPAVRKYVSKYSLDEALVLATIHTESYFNPLARSSCGAIGLMQLMPDRGGLEAYRFVFNEGGVPSENFPYDAENNIQLGCAYIHILQNQ
jgi:membrane-bound lytic murein transglycosylase C